MEGQPCEESETVVMQTQTQECLELPKDGRNKEKSIPRGLERCVALGASYFVFFASRTVTE